jgi:hypothetical protein
MRSITRAFDRNRKRITAAIAAGLLAGVMAGTALSGSASAQTTGATERFAIITTSPSAPGRVIATGAFHAVGTVTEIQTSDTSAVATFVFPNGTFELSRADNPGGSGSFNTVTCVGHFSGTGNYVIIPGSGTGAYSGISGRGTYSDRGTIVATRGPGGCMPPPVSLFDLGRARGSVSFS